MTFLNIGYSNMVASEHIVAVIGSDSAPAKRLVGEAKESGRVIDATCGKRTQSVIVTDSDHVILSALAPDALYRRASGAEDE